MASSYKVSLPVIRRLPRYYRYLTELSKQGVQRISSSELAVMMGSTASQVRQDFNCFGGFGQQGIGYNTAVLLGEMRKLLFKSTQIPAVMVGAGSLGTAVARYMVSKDTGVRLEGAFDNSEKRIGGEILGVPILDMDTLKEYCEQHKPEILVVCLPPEAAAREKELLCSLGMRGIWNFSHFDFALSCPDSPKVENVHLGDSLMSLAFQIHHSMGDGTEMSGKDRGKEDNR